MKECCNLHEIINSFSGQLKGYLVNKTKDPELASELLQEVMYKAVQAHQQSIPVENMRAWLFKVTRNILIDYYRQQQLHFELPSGITDETLIIEQEPAIVPIIDKYLRPMIELLPIKYAQPLILGDLENLSQKQIAQQLGLSLTATKSRIQRARKLLYNLFFECCEVELDTKGRFVSCTVKETCQPLKKV